MVAMGTAEQPIAFRSVEVRQNELDDIIQVQQAREAHFRYCVFERGPWALHIHETDADVISCVFRDNYGGVRFQGDRVVLRGNRFEWNTLGVRCLKATPVVEENAFVGNATGIFFREGVEGAVVRRNNFDNVEYDVKLGESQSADVDAAQNWWAPLKGGAPDERIYDGADAPGLGRVLVAPPLPAPWGQEAKAK
jgi:nitrous oxidase accessory protein NosD